MSRLSEEQINNIKELGAQGKTSYAIAKTLKISLGAVAHHLRKAETSRSDVEHSDVENDDLNAAIEQLKSKMRKEIISEIVNKL